MDISAQWGLNAVSNASEFILDESMLPEQVVDDLRRYLLQRSLTIGKASTRKLNGDEIHSGKAILRGLDCQIDVYLAGDKSLMVLCAKPERPESFWKFSECFPEIPDAAAAKDFFFGNPPQEFKEPLLAKVGLADSVWVLISAADERLIEQNAHDILAKMGTWLKNGQDTSKLAAGLNMFGRPSFGGSDYLRADDLLKAVLPEDWNFMVQANVEYRGGAPVLSLPIPLVSRELSLGPCKLTELTVWLSTPMYYVRRAPDVRLEATLRLRDNTSFTFAADYPLDDDIIEARLEVEAGKRPPFIGDTPHLPDLTGPDIELTVGVSLSKSEKALKNAYLDLVLRKEWEIVPDVLKIANPEFHFLVLDPVADVRRVVARVAGELVIADSRLVVSGNYAVSEGYSEGQFTVALDPETPLSLTTLVQYLRGKDAGPVSPALPEYTLETLLFECDLTGHMFMETSVSVPWGIELTSDVSLDFKQLRFLFEKWGDSTRFRAGADLELGGVRFNLSGDYSSESGWLFQGATYPGDKINIGAFARKIADELGAERTIPASLADVSLQDVAVSFNTKTNDLAFSITTTFPVGEKELEAVVTIEKTGTELKFGGKITVGGAEFTLDFTSNRNDKVLEATWTKTDNKPGLDLTTLSNHGVPGLEDFGTLLRPKKATLTLNLEEDARSLNLGCDLENGRAEVLLAKHEGEWIAALRFEAPPVSMEDLGPLGDVLKPHNIALKDLVIVAASADAPKDQPSFKLQDQSFSKGLLLQGALEFEETSFSYHFECWLGGEERDEQPKALPAGGAGKTAPAASVSTVASSGETPAAEEGKNNVAVGRTIGPVTFRRARLESRNKCVYVLLDASLGSGGFALDLTGFNLNFPLTLLQDPIAHARDIKVGLDGLSISYSKPPLTISGGFARTKAVDPYVDDLYQGHLLIKAEAFQITVLGSYGNIKVREVDGKPITKPSLFLFGTYAGVVGGPPAFFVTGLALGGGYNTRLALPPIEKVAEFPLVQAVTDPKRFTNDALMKAVQPSYGDYWLAVGVKFNSFKMADSFALFSVSFGTRLQFALLGLTKFTVPTGAKEGKCAVYAELAIRAVLDPEAGVFSIEGRLTQNSYVLAREFRLTGGFAFFIWFGHAPEAGDFVISLGGYHPAFLRPAHYPIVPRVGIQGQLSKALSITGEAYLALTPSCLMAGLKLEAVFRSGRIRATFVAYADFIIVWAPFQYDARIGIGIAVAVRLWRTFKLQLSASLHVWGPPFGGTARVSYWIVSFTVAFGDTSGKKPPPLNWDEFQNAFLPPHRDAADRALLSTIRITEGLVREVKRGEGKNEVMYRIVNPHELMIETDSAVPCTEVCVGTAPPRTGTAKIGIRPMKARTLTSRHAVNIKTCDGDSAEEKFKTVQWSRKNFPEALWSPSQATGRPEAGMVKDVLSGVVLRVQSKTPQHPLGPFLIEKFKYEPIPKQIPWSAAPPLPSELKGEFSGVSADNWLRDQIRACLEQRIEKAEKPGWNTIAMTNTSKNLNEHFQAPPTCAALGQSIKKEYKEEEKKSKRD
jgi:hypothetical protein